jgi:nitroreductase
MSVHSGFEVLSEIIRKRKTSKVFGRPEQPVRLGPAATRQFDPLVRQAVAVAGLAPFHFARNIEGIAEPWRVTVLWWEACRSLALELPELGLDLKPGNKLPALLSACGAAILVHWLRANPDEIDDAARREETNSEHLAAASAYVQNLLLLLTAAELESYWASASPLDLPPLKHRLGIPANRKLVGAILVGYPLAETAELERAGGGNHARRAPAEAWSRELGRLS